MRSCEFFLIMSTLHIGHNFSHFQVIKECGMEANPQAQVAQYSPIP